MSADSRAARDEVDGSERENATTAASALVTAGVSYVRHLVELAAAEARLAAISGVSMLMMVIVAAVLVIVAWILVTAVVAYALVALGLPWPAAGLGLALVHAMAAYFLWRGAVRLSSSLTMPALRRAVLETEE